MFLEKGFDDFISKPIDMRQLNTVLSKLVRDKHMLEIINEAKQQTDDKEEQSSDSETQTAINPQFVEVFVRDAGKAITTLETIYEKRDAYDDEDIRMYEINTHGIKTALANIGKSELSAFAFKLEVAGRNKNTGIMSSETPAFLNSLRALVEELTPKTEKADSETMDSDRPYLLKKLLEVKAACGEYNEIIANDIITELREKVWAQATKELLGTIAEHLLHSDFDEIVDVVEKFMDK
jgi:HPt (histidine-containing phosphotransfer) domain-containing protein